jgi:hypothetical protein
MVSERIRIKDEDEAMTDKITELSPETDAHNVAHGCFSAAIGRR